MANDHVSYNVNVEDGNYVIHYTFKDHLDKVCSITWKLNKKQTDRDIREFGIPKSMFEPFPDLPEYKARHKEIIGKGLFMEKGNTIIVDKNAMINKYASYTKILANWMIKYLKNNYTDTRLNRIKLAMCFVQDIPYAVPDDFDPNWYYGGVIATPNIFTCGYGDCDTKAILFVGILCHLISPDDIRFAGEPGHVYTIIKNDDTKLVENGTTTYFELEDGKYVVAETAGPGRLNFGEAHSSKYNSARIEKINFLGPR